MGCGCSSEASGRQIGNRVRRRRRRNSDLEWQDVVPPPASGDEEPCSNMTGNSQSFEGLSDSNPLGADSSRRRATLPTGICNQPIGPTPLGSCNNSSSNNSSSAREDGLPTEDSDSWEEQEDASNKGRSFSQQLDNNKRAPPAPMNFFQPLSINNTTEGAPSIDVLSNENSMETSSPSRRRRTLAGSQDIPRINDAAAPLPNHHYPIVSSPSGGDALLHEHSSSSIPTKNSSPPEHQRTMTLRQEDQVPLVASSTTSDAGDQGSDTPPLRSLNSSQQQQQIRLPQSQSLSLNSHSFSSATTPPRTVASSLTDYPFAAGPPPEQVPVVTISKGEEEERGGLANWSFNDRSVNNSNSTTSRQKDSDGKEFNTPPSQQQQPPHRLSSLDLSKSATTNNSNPQLVFNSSINPLFPSAPAQGIVNSPLQQQPPPPQQQPNHLNGSMNFGGRMSLEKSHSMMRLSAPCGVSEAAENTHDQLHEASRFRFRHESSTFSSIYHGGCKFQFPDNGSTLLQVASKGEMLESEELESSLGVTNTAGCLLWPAPRSIVSLVNSKQLRGSSASSSRLRPGSENSSSQASTTSSPGLDANKVYDVLPFTQGWEDLQNHKEEELDAKDSNSFITTPSANQSSSARPPSDSRSFHPRGSFHSMSSAQSSPNKLHPQPAPPGTPNRAPSVRSSLCLSSAGSTPLIHQNPNQPPPSIERQPCPPVSCGLPSFKLPQAVVETQVTPPPLQQEHLDALIREGSYTATPPTASLVTGSAPAFNHTIFAPPVRQRTYNEKSHTEQPPPPPSSYEPQSMDGSGGSAKLELLDGGTPPQASDSITSGVRVGEGAISLLTRSDTIQSIDPEDFMKMSFADSAQLDQLWAQGPDAYSGNFILVPIHLIRSPDTLPGVSAEDLVTERRAATRHILDTIGARLDELDSGDYDSVRRYAQRHLTAAQRTGLRELESTFTMLLAVLMDIQALALDPGSFHELVAQSPGAHFIEEFVTEQTQQQSNDIIAKKGEKMRSEYADDRNPCSNSVTSTDVSDVSFSDSETVSPAKQEEERRSTSVLRDTSSFPAYLQDRFRHDALYCLLAAHFHSRSYLSDHLKHRASLGRKNNKKARSTKLLPKN